MQKKQTIILVLALIVLVGGYLWWQQGSSEPKNNLDTSAVDTEDVALLEPGSVSIPATSPTPAPLPSSGAGERIMQNGVAVTVIHLTDRGFEPHEVTVKSGEEVRFVNKTSGAMRIGTNSSATSQFYASFTQPNVVGTNGTFQIGLVPLGVWSYTNLTNPKGVGASGTVYIK